MNKQDYVTKERFIAWAEDNNWLCVEDDIYLTPNGVLVYITVIDGMVRDIKVTNDSGDF
jgi:hypothetical protein